MLFKLLILLLHPQVKENWARTYHIVEQYHQVLTNPNQQTFPVGMNNAISEFSEALHRSQQTTEALNNCNQVIQDISNRVAA